MRWAGHVARMGDRRWTKLILDWSPIGTAREELDGPRRDGKKAWKSLLEGIWEGGGGLKLQKNGQFGKEWRLASWRTEWSVLSASLAAR